MTNNNEWEDELVDKFYAICSNEATAINFIKKVIDKTIKAEREKLVEIVEKYKDGVFNENGGHKCWIVDEILEAIKQ